MSPNKLKTIYIRTFGCQMNELDSQKMALIMRPLGFDLVDDPKKANIILFNTCTIREKAYHKALSEIGRTEVLKKRDPSIIVGVCGCVAQQEKNAIISRFPHVDMVFGPDSIAKLPILVEDVIRGNRPVATELVNDVSQYEFIDDIPEVKPGAVSAFVSIMKGCNCACSYCIVPKVRGKEVCRPQDAIISEVKRLVSTGTKEVVLLGQNVNSYDNFSSLLRRISDETDILRIRFMSPHPKDVKEDLIQEYADNKKLCPHIHLPLQSGADATLKRMRRGYTKERYLAICEALKVARPGLQITTDIIVGFCGESDDDFDETIDVMNKVRFDGSFSFKYSPRPGTYASEKLLDDVPEEVKATRLDAVLQLQADISRASRTEIIGAEDDALIYEHDKMGKGLFTGRFPDNRIVHFAGEKAQIGDIVRLRIVRANKNSFFGEVV